MGLKTKSLQTAFWKFLILLIAGLSGAVLLPFSILLFGVTCGYATYANFSEQSVKNAAPVIAAAPDITEVHIPAGCRFLLLDQNYHIIDTTLNEQELKNALEYARSGKTDGNPEKQYLLIKRENETVVLQYYIGSQFTNEWLNEHLPTPEFLLYCFIFVNCILVCTILTTVFAKKLRLQLTPLFDATAEIAAQNLDFEMGHSDIKEFEDVLISFSDMKNNLQSFLEKQWRTEQAQKEQIAALAHDLKTPLTVIQGNIDLMDETNLDSEQKLYADYISQSSEQMQTYIKILIDLSKQAVGYELHKETVSLYDYMAHILEQIRILCRTKNVTFESHVSLNNNQQSQQSNNKENVTILIDRFLIERAIMNVINNAIDYSPENGTVTFSAEITHKTASSCLQITITDEGTGFSEAALHHAKEQFFMDDSSRNDRMHIGMGLYTAASVLEQHNGEIWLENREDGMGARVRMELPVEI